MSLVVAAKCLLVSSFFSGGFSLRLDASNSLANAHFSHKKPSCIDDFKELQAGMICVATWGELREGLLRATQPAVGYAWVQRQREHHFMSTKRAKKWLKKNEIKTVIGDSNLYLTDSHHHLLAMELAEDKDIWDLKMHIYIQCDLRGAGDDFWPRMQKESYVLLYNRPRESPFELPSLADVRSLPQDWKISSFTDDVWRSLAGFASHVDEPCYTKACTGHMDFEWSYVLNKHTVDQSAWPSKDHAIAFTNKLKAIPYPFQLDSSERDLSTWKDLANDVQKLCHSPALNGYPLPANFPSERLQGWSAVPVSEDPDCPLTQCAITTHRAAKNGTSADIIAHYDGGAKIRTGEFLLKGRHEPKAQKKNIEAHSTAEKKKVEAHSAAEKKKVEAHSGAEEKKVELHSGAEERKVEPHSGAKDKKCEPHSGACDNSFGLVVAVLMVSVLSV
eukprot:gnl/TRDRNA2_/TRDRNA2_153024_c0_seq2.p1 gnl/TRDRNA2_/TRDRNA2_153024_c0~~gnl/TRDRNA2_/TRDRNA2_153024_c0_seq2.p1  ORF type:complete len:446 (+),score=80.28 gnl/TRDRNA2_/TRDRNA2_153024_c0_seq2:52-1389(+)